MAFTEHTVTVPVFTKTLGNMLIWLDKAEAFAKTKGFDVNLMLQMRLAPDMFPLVRQFQSSCDTAKFCVARLGGVDSPKFEDTETTLDEIRDRIRKTLEFIASVPAEKLEGSSARELSIPRRNGPVKMSGETHLRHHCLPNFYFHASMAYGVLRHNGVDVGKRDFLGEF